MQILIFSFLLGEKSEANLVLDGELDMWEKVKETDSEWSYLSIGCKDWDFGERTAFIEVPRIFAQIAQDSGLLKKDEDSVRVGGYSANIMGSFYLKPINQEAYMSSDGDEYLVNYLMKGTGQSIVHFHVYGEMASSKILTYTQKPLLNGWKSVTQKIKVFGQGDLRIFPRIDNKNEILIDNIFIWKEIKKTKNKLIKIESRHNERIAFSTQIKRRMIIDGIDDEVEWQKPFLYSGFRDFNHQNMYSFEKTLFKCLHNNEYIYFYFKIYNRNTLEMNFEEKPKEKGELKDRYTDQNSIELFLRPNNSNRFFQFVVSSNGAWYDGDSVESKKWDSDFRFNVVKERGYWTVELEIPVKSMGVNFEDVGEWGMNIASNRDGNDSTWSAVGGRFHNPYKFGKINFNSIDDWVAGSMLFFKNIDKELLNYSQNEKLTKLKVNINKAIKINQMIEISNWKEVTDIYCKINYLKNTYKSFLYTESVMSQIKERNEK